MLFTKSKMMIGLATAVVLSMGGAAGFAAAPQPSLTPVPHVDVSKIEAQKGECKIVGDIDPAILESLKYARTAPNPAMDAE
jgi:hypothetical protein